MHVCVAMCRLQGSILVSPHLVRSRIFWHSYFLVCSSAAGTGALLCPLERELDATIIHRKGLPGQAAFATLPLNCEADKCLFHGMVGGDNGQGLRVYGCDGGGCESINGPGAAHTSQSWDPELVKRRPLIHFPFLESGRLVVWLGRGLVLTWCCRWCAAQQSFHYTDTHWMAESDRRLVPIDLDVDLTFEFRIEESRVIFFASCAYSSECSEDR